MDTARCSRLFSERNVDLVAHLGIFALDLAARRDAPAGFEDEALGRVLDKADEHGTVERAAVAPPRDAGVPPAVVAFGFGDEAAGGAFGRSCYAAGREQAEEEVAQVGGIVGREAAYDFATRLEQSAAVGFDAFDVAVARHTDVFGHTAQVVAQEVDHGGVFGGFFRVGQEMRFGALAVGERALHGKGADVAVGDAHKGFGRETNPPLGHEKAVAGPRSGEDVGEGEGRFDGNPLGEVGQEGVAAPQTALHEGEGAGVVGKSGEMGREGGGLCDTDARGADRCRPAGRRNIGDAAEIIGQLVGREGIEWFDHGLFGRIVDEKHERPPFGGEMVEARDGVVAAVEGKEPEGRRETAVAHRAVGRAASTQPIHPVESS